MTGPTPPWTDRHPHDPAITVSTDPDLLDRDLVHRFLAEESYWASGVPRPIVDRAIDHSLPFGLYRGDGQIGFARVITDHATFGYLADVFVLPSDRGGGLGRWLVGRVLAHPGLQILRRITLATADAQALYAGLGFTPGRPGVDMEIRRAADELYAGFTGFDGFSDP
jgi:GNAT superfamily N-acetyltransferase